jgi:hypothetical protein
MQHVKIMFIVLHHLMFRDYKHMWSHLRNNLDLKNIQTAVTDITSKSATNRLVLMQQLCKEKTSS